MRETGEVVVCMRHTHELSEVIGPQDSRLLWSVLILVLNPEVGVSFLIGMFSIDTDSDNDYKYD